MGGTSFEVGLIVDGRPIVADQQIIDQYTFHQTAPRRPLDRVRRRLDRLPIRRTEG